MLGTYGSYKGQLEASWDRHGAAIWEPTVALRPTWGILRPSRGCMLGTYGSYGVNLKHLRTIMGLHVGNLR